MATKPQAPEPAGPENRLEQAYQQYRLELRRFFGLNARDPYAVDDLMQMMYVQLLKTRRGAEDIQEPQAYLYRTAWNVLHSVNRRREAERARSVPLDPQSMEALADRSNTLWIEDDAPAAVSQEEIEQVLGELPNVCQLALLRQYRDNHSYRQIAQELGVSVHAVKKYIMRALNHFRMHFNSSGDAR